MDQDPFNDSRISVAFDTGFQALGQVVYFFQQLEDYLGRAVSFLIDPESGDVADIVVCELSFKQLVAIGYSVFEKYAEAEKVGALAEWKLILSKASQAEASRNAILHSTFGVSCIDAPVFTRSKSTAKFKKGFRESGEAFDDETVTRYLNEIGGVSTDLMDFMGRTFPDWNTRTWRRED